jgi:hypothetical protein
LRVDAAARRPGAAAVEGFAAMLLAPMVHQGIAGAAVETDGRAVGAQRGEIADAAEIEHRQ